MDQLPRHAIGLPGRQRAGYARRAIRTPLLLSFALVSTFTSAPAARAEPAHFWLSTLDMSTNGPQAPTVQGAIGSIQNVYIWARPETFTNGTFNRMQNFSLNVVSSNPLVDFLDGGVTVYNPQRFEYKRDSNSSPAIKSDATHDEVLMNEPDGIHNIQGFTFNTGGNYAGIGPSPTVYSNPNRITIPSIGAATPYPSNISVSGVSDTVTDVNVSLLGFTHTYLEDVDILLVGPAGQKMILASDVGGSTDISGVNLTLDDAAAGSLPDSGPIISGTFRPTNIGTGDSFPTPAPAGPYAATLAAFNGTNPNGTWSLYVYDAVGGDSGSISGGWSLAIPTSGSCTPSSLCARSPDGTPAWLVGSVAFRPIREGTTNFFLQVGSNGINHFGETTGQTEVLFGTDSAANVTYNAATHRDVTRPGDTPDLVFNALTTAGLPGDYNDDGIVDAGDYIVWRKNGANPLPNDNGLTTSADRFNLWKANFGDISGSGSSQTAGLSSAVPEPSTITLFVLGLISVVWRR